ncbi:glucose-1-phosphate adenylyltransferase [Alteromonas sp. ASW11-36]|uniref:Glucose-1-phosphate adenylyltransferase n=1 Tax=Alteromonas arenosi TaxID=3055817 RepID=A0ABT7T068_9ALTE|nr:glucose-1-phosphate adenylyltransferase [Alteromonas sp. ASW11-36]MDM7861835.1 glucose-1-phosphate adenylyltransferase [Alteromonas sp. ASW11-36]
MSRTLAMILAGGEGKRLYPLTKSRSKPAVPFAGNMRIIDFALNNFVNSDFLKIYVLTQFKSQSLSIHLGQAWHLSGVTDNFIQTVPAQMRMGKHWYEGTADAIYQNSKFIGLHHPDHVCVFGGDHVYKMNVREMVEYHERKQSELTVCAIRMPLQQASRFGVIEIDDDYRMIGFVEKPSHPKPLPDDPTMALVSMGNYVFETEFLYSVLEADAKNVNSAHDFGGDVIPAVFPKHRVFVYDFSQNTIKGEKDCSYWRDVGTLETFWQSHMDLLHDRPGLNLINPKWPMRSYYPPLPAAKVLSDSQGNNSVVVNSILASGCQVTAATLVDCVLGFGVQVGAHADIRACIFLGKAHVGENCRLNRVIVDKNVYIEDGIEIGFDREADLKRGLTVSETGIVVIPKGYKVC